MAKLVKDSKTAMITNKVRFSYANVYKPTSMKEGEAAKYSVSILISKDDTETLDLVMACCKEAAQIGISKLGGKIPKPLKIPLRDGDEEKPDNAEYENCMFMSATSKRPPGVVKKVDGKAVSIADDEFYSGCYGLASINFYAFNVNSKGIACGLNNIMKTEDGDRLSGGGSSAADDFGLEEEGDEFM